LAVAVTRTTNPLLLALVLAVLALVVTSRRTDAPWARAFRYYLALAAVVIAIRVVFRSVFSGAMSTGDHVLFRLPHLVAPAALGRVSVGGPVTLEATLSAAVDGLRLGVLLCCIGAANVLADPKRALRVLPGALYELGVAVTVAMTAAPQLVDSVSRVRRARRLRGADGRGLRRLRAVAVPVLEDALERSLRLAASMDSRGYGRTGETPRSSRRLTAGLLFTGMLGLCAGVYGLYDASAPAPFGIPAVVAGACLCGSGLLFGGRRVRRSSYRPDPWRLPEWGVSACGAAAAALVLAGGSNDTLNPVMAPLAWPPLPALPALGIVLAALPALIAPPPPMARRRSAARSRRADDRSAVPASSVVAA
jgi:energy-coupling factor transport system permease protein